MTANTMIRIKRGTIEDTKTLLRLSKRLFGELGHQFPISDGNKAEAFCLNLLENEDYVVFIASDSGRSPCGFITLNEGVSLYAGGTFGVIREFYVTKEKRSVGIGTALLQSAMEYARSKSWKRLEVTPPHREKWKRTHDFYIREGFVEVGSRLKIGVNE